LATNIWKLDIHLIPAHNGSFSEEAGNAIILLLGLSGKLKK
jgi:hypothetical protein